MKITKTDSGKYTALVAINGIDGSRHYKRFTAKSKDEVRNRANEYLNSHKVYIESMSFSASAERFIARSERVLSPNTIRGYKGALRALQSDYGAFCTRSVDCITQSDLQAIVTTMTDVGKSPKTVKNRIGFISAVLSSEGIRMPRLQLPKQQIKEPHVPTESLISQVAAAAANTRLEVPFVLAVFGLRCGEVCAVTAEDLDGNVLHVHHAIATDDYGVTHVKSPKTSASDRYIVIPDHIADAIRAAGRATDMTPHAWSDAFPHLLKKAGVPEDQRFRLHDCRHFFVSYCHDVLKLSDAEIIKLSGHQTDSVMKRIYRHAITDNSPTVQAKLSAIIM